MRRSHTSRKNRPPVTPDCQDRLRSRVVMPAASAVPVPDDIPDEIAAAIMMQGITAHHFTTEAAPVQPYQVTLVHPSARVLGQLLIHLTKALGGRVIRLASTAAKAETACKD